MNKIALIVLVACMLASNSSYAVTSTSVECTISPQSSPAPNVKIFNCDFPPFYLLDDGKIITTQFQKAHLTVTQTTAPGVIPQITGVLSFEYYNLTSTKLLGSLHLSVDLLDASHTEVAGGATDYSVARDTCNYNGIWTPVVWSFAVGVNVHSLNFDSIKFAIIDGEYGSNQEGKC